jgi:hypothetical protein
VATAIALEIGSVLCPVLREQPFIERGVLTFHVYDPINKVLEVYGVPKGCFKQKSKVLIVDLMLCNLPKLSSLIKEVLEGRAVVMKVLSLTMCPEVKEFLNRNGIPYKEIVKG